MGRWAGCVRHRRSSKSTTPAWKKSYDDWQTLFAAWSKANPELKTIPILAVTSYALSGDEEKARAAGCDGYIAKPYSPRQMLAKVREILK